MEKKNKLKELLLALSTEEEKLGYSAIDKISEVQKDVRNIKPDEVLRDEVQQLKRAVNILPKSFDTTPIVEALKSVREILSKPQEKQQDLSGFFKDMPVMLAGINASSKKTSELITNLKWNSTMGVKNSTGSPINPAVDSFNIGDYDDIVLAYTGTNLTTVTYKKTGNTVAILILSYDGSNNLIEVNRTT